MVEYKSGRLESSEKPGSALRSRSSSPRQLAILVSCFSGPIPHSVTSTKEVVNDFGQSYRKDGIRARLE